MELEKLSTVELDRRKKILEIENLEKENRKARRWFVFNPDNWGALLTVIGALLALLFAYETKWFDYQAKYLDYRNENLKFDNNKLDLEKNRIKSSIDSMKSVLSFQKTKTDSLYTANNNLQIQLVQVKKADSLLKQSFRNPANQTRISNQIKLVLNGANLIPIVVDSQGKHIEPYDMVIKIYKGGTGPNSYSIITPGKPTVYRNNQLVYSLPAGNYQIFVKAKGYRESGVMFDLKSGETKSVKFILAKRIHSDVFDDSFD